MAQKSENQLQYSIDKVIEENERLKKRLELIESNYEELLSKEIRFHSLIENLSAGFIINDILGNCIYANDHLVNLFGYNLHEILKRPLKRLIDSKSFYVYETELAKVKNGESCRFELEMIHHNRSIISVLVTLSPLIDQNGNYNGNYGLLSDVTKRKQAQKALLENEEKYRNLVERAHDGIGIIQDDYFKYVNNQLALLTESSVEELMNKPFLNIFSKDDQEKLSKEYSRHLNGEVSDKIYQAKLCTKFGNIKYVEINGGFIHYQGQNADLIIIRDISDRKKINAELIESRKKYKVLEANIPLGIYRSTPDGILVSGNPSMLNLFGFKSELEIKDFDVSKLYQNREQRDKFITQLNKDGTVEGYEIELKRLDGSSFWASISTTTVFDKHMEPVFYDGIIRDISEKKQAEISIRESEEKFRTISEQSIMAIAILQEGIIKYMNNAFCELFEFSRDEIQKWGPHRYLKAVHWDSISTVLDRGRQMTKDPENEGNRFTFKGITKTGKLKYVDNYSKIIMFQGKPAMLMSLIDITDRKLMEAEIQRAQKLESTGLLAGGIAHDFNNRLSVILGNAQLARLYFSQKDKLVKYLENIEQSAAQATSLTQQLLTFSKGGAPIKTVCNVKEMIKEAINLSLSGSNAFCITNFQDDLFNIDVDKGQITQVLNNILINADQAMPSGGKIHITGENHDHSPKDPIQLRGSKYVRITIKDQGTGIPATILDKIFDPYFTTKQKGSGLGLAVAYSIVEKHKGFLMVESELGQGTTFLLYLPATNEQISLEKVMDINTSKGSGYILVMDDEELVLDMVGDILLEAGYEVALAKDGQETLDIYMNAKNSDKPFQAVIMDLTIPGGMGGKETMVELKKFDPNVKAIVSSGYSNDPIMSDYESFGFAGVIAKPYKIKALQDTLNQVLNQ